MQKLSRNLLFALIAFYSVLFVVRAVVRGDDFVVFYNVAKGFWSGVSPYSVEQYGNMVFKYPPWYLTAFLPFSLLPKVAAQVLWGLLEALGLCFTVHCLRKKFKIDDGVLLLVFLLSAGLMINQARAAQLSILFLAAAFLSKQSYKSWLFTTFLFSSKLLTLFPFLGESLSRGFFKKSSVLALVFVVFSLPVLIVIYDGDGAMLVHDWLKAMFDSGSMAKQGVGVVSFVSREAQGFPSLVLRLFDLNESFYPVIFSILASFAFLVAFGFLISKKLNPDDHWWVWLSLTPLLQPLAWFHFFLLVIPFVSFQLNRYWQKKHKFDFCMFTALFLLVTVVSEKTMGQFGHNLEMLSIKSWGVLLMLLYAVIRWEGKIEQKRA